MKFFIYCISILYLAFSYYYCTQYQKLPLELLLYIVTVNIILCALFVAFAQKKLLQSNKKTLEDDPARIGHDIKSPLTTLQNLMLSSKDLNTKEAELCRYALAKINSLASLLTRKKTEDISDIHVFFTLVEHSLENLVFEKQMLLQDKNIEIKINKAATYQSGGIHMSESLFIRNMTNLINNSIEAFHSLNRAGKISLSLDYQNTDDKEYLLINIEDNGCGMSADVLAKVRYGQASFNKPSGHGLGIRSFIECLHEYQGQFEIDSKAGEGTTIKIKVPYSTQESWLADSINLSSYKKVVLLEDDKSIVEMWQARLKQIPTQIFYDSKSFDEHPIQKDALYILDNQITGSPIQGIDLMEKHNLGPQAILCTSYYNNDKIQARIIACGARLLPKYQINTIPIKSQEPAAKSNKELVLIDDDELVHQFWEHQAAKQKIKLKYFFSTAEFLNAKLGKDSVIYLDQNLKDGKIGHQEAKELYKQGYKNLNITTSEPEKIAHVKKLSYIQNVCNKNFPTHSL